MPYDAWYGALERGRFDMGMWFGERGPTPYQFYRSQLDPPLVQAGRREGERQLPPLRRARRRAALLRRFEASSDHAEQMEVGRGLQKIYVDEAPSLPLFASPLWGVFTRAGSPASPAASSPYAGAVAGAPLGQPPVLVAVKPR